jgi:hypothetical protein
VKSDHIPRYAVIAADRASSAKDAADGVDDAETADVTLADGDILPVVVLDDEDADRSPPGFECGSFPQPASAAVSTAMQHMAVTIRLPPCIGTDLL